MDIQTAIDRITEIESLTDEMDDECASWIINWAIETLKVKLPQITDDDRAAEETDDMIGVVKQLNGITASIDQKKTSVLPARVAQFVAAYQKAFGQAQPVDPARTAAEIAPKSPREAMEYLLQVVAPPPTMDR